MTADHSPEVLLQLLEPDLPEPSYAHPGDAGADLVTRIDVVIPPQGRVTVPTGVAVFPKEIITPVRRWMEPNFHNITHWSEMEKGGHFAAFEQPELYVDEVRNFFRTVR